MNQYNFSRYGIDVLSMHFFFPFSIYCYSPKSIHWRFFIIS